MNRGRPTDASVDSDAEDCGSSASPSIFCRRPKGCTGNRRETNEDHGWRLARVVWRGSIPALLRLLAMDVSRGCLIRGIAADCDVLAHSLHRAVARRILL